MPDLYQHLAEWRDLCAGVSLLYAGTEGIFDEHTERMKTAIATDDLEDMDHFSAVMLTMMRGLGQDVTNPSKWWGKLDKEFHAHFCQDEICVKRRQHETAHRESN